MGEIGRGGAAVVYLARDLDLDRLVALKELRVSGSRPEDFARRFLRESRVAGALSHPNIVTVYEYLEHDGSPYIAMEYLERGSLRPYVGTLAPATLAGVLEGVLAALTCAESAGVVHRDLKPENIMVTGDGRVKLTDFGIAKATQKVGADQFETAVGMTVGTPSYMAPEQALGEPVGPWTDLYSVGIMTWEHLVGHVPFSDATSTPTAVLLRHVNEDIPAPIAARPDIDPALSEWVTRLVANRPDGRPQKASEAWDALEQIVVAQLGPLWRRDAGLTEEHSGRSPAIGTPDPVDRFGAFPVIAKPAAEIGAPTPQPQGPPAPDDEAAYYTYLGEKAAAPAPADPGAAPADPGAPPIAPAPLPMPRSLVLRPEAVRVRPGERVEIEAALEGGPVPTVQWELTGDASAFAIAKPNAPGAVIELHPRLGEPPRSSSLEVRCVDRGAEVAVASATVEILAEEATAPAAPPVPVVPTPTAPPAPPQPIAGPAPWRTPALLVALSGCLLLIAALCLNPLGYLVATNDKKLSLLNSTNGNPDTPLHASNTFRPLIILTGIALVLVLASLASRKRVFMLGAVAAGLAVIGYSIHVHSLSPGLDPAHYSTGFALSIAGAAVLTVGAAAASLARSR